jgi:hypothetical protein
MNSLEAIKISRADRYISSSSMTSPPSFPVDKMLANNLMHDQSFVSFLQAMYCKLARQS